jgi:hypothetical protein
MDAQAGGAVPKSRANGLVPFLSEALSGVLRREMLIPALLLLVVLTASNIVILRNMPAAEGALPPLPFLVAALVRLVGLFILAVGILRIAAASERPPWRPDGGFWLYPLTFLAGVAINTLVGRLLGDRTDLAVLVASNILVTVLLAPLVVWVVAIVVARPLAWRPRPWLRDFRRWLPQLLFWTLLLVTPMAVLHASIDMWLIKGAGEWFWPAALFDGALSTLMAVIGLGLNAAAYRRVARG